MVENMEGYLGRENALNLYQSVILIEQVNLFLATETQNSQNGH